MDWIAGIQAELARLLGAGHAARLLMRYHELEPRVQSETRRACYRDVMAAVLAELASGAGRELAPEDEDALGRSLAAWPVFAEVCGQLEEARQRGWQLVVLSNSDRDLIEASIGAIGVPFSAAIVAFEVGSYTPALGHWRAFYDATHADRERHVYVAQSRAHNIVPPYELGIRSVWVNQLGERAQPTPTRELPDLHGLADVLDERVP